jgi:hypothetical protein
VKKRSKPLDTLIRALARAPRWKWLLDERRYGSTAEIAEAEKIEPCRVCRQLYSNRRSIAVVGPLGQHGVEDAEELSRGGCDGSLDRFAGGLQAIPERLEGNGPT